MALTKEKLIEIIESGALDAYLTGGGAAVDHTHGNITSDGKIGTAATKPIITGTNGALQAGAFGTTSGSFCEGNDSRLSDARTPTTHTHTGYAATDHTHTGYAATDHDHDTDYLPKDSLTVALVTADLDDLTVAWALMHSNSTHLPTAHYYYVNTIRYSTAKMQIAYGHNTDAAYYRHTSGGGWSSWIQLH